MKSSREDTMRAQTRAEEVEMQRRVTQGPESAPLNDVWDTEEMHTGEKGLIANSKWLRQGL